MHYPALAPIIKEAAAKHGLHYQIYPTFWSALRAHFRHLAKVGNPRCALASNRGLNVSLFIIITLHTHSFATARLSTTVSEAARRRALSSRRRRPGAGAHLRSSPQLVVRASCPDSVASSSPPSRSGITAIFMRASRGHGDDARARPSSTSRSSSKTSHKQIVRRLYREVWNNADLDGANEAVAKYVSDEHVLIDPSNPNPEPGTDAYMRHVRGNSAEALPDHAIAIDYMIEEGDKVVAQLSFRASLNGREAKWTGTCVMEFEDDYIIKSWVNTDAMSAMIQPSLMTDLVHTGNLKSRPVTHALMVEMNRTRRTSAHG